jgi:hypothetical protein
MMIHITPLQFSPSETMTLAVASNPPSKVASYSLAAAPDEEK